MFTTVDLKKKVRGHSSLLLGIVLIRTADVNDFAKLNRQFSCLKFGHQKAMYLSTGTIMIYAC